MARDADIPTRPSVCPLDCPDTCSLSVEVDADGLRRVRGSRANPYTDGVICAKVACAGRCCGPVRAGARHSARSAGTRRWSAFTPVSAPRFERTARRPCCR